MKKGYLFIANSSKPTEEKANSEAPFVISTFGYAPFYAADTLGYTLYMGVNRNHPESLKCTNFDVTFYNQHIYRDVFAWKDNWQAYKNLCRFLEKHPEIEVIHCNTPIGGVVGRLCGKKYHKKVIYTAHGFHFYKGAPLKNWLLFYPIEKILARLTDALITINQEDYKLAKKKFRLRKGGKVYFIPGVGIETSERMDNCEEVRMNKLCEIGIDKSAFLGIIVGDLNDNKNVETLIKALPQCNSKVHYIICGVGPNEENLKSLSKRLGVDDRCHFLGFRKDIKELYMASDVFLFASKREGLPRSTMEAMLYGLPCVVSNIRGNVDLVDDSSGGVLISPTDYISYAEAINRFVNNNLLCEQYGKYNKQKIKMFDMEMIKQKMLEVYKESLIINE